MGNLEDAKSGQAEEDTPYSPDADIQRQQVLMSLDHKEQATIGLTSVFIYSTHCPERPGLFGRPHFDAARRERALAPGDWGVDQGAK